MRALVTGAAGFLGSHLCDRLRRDGVEVLGLDNFYTGRRENLAHLSGDPGFSFFEHDVTRPLDAAAVAGPLDLVFNMACPGSPFAFQRDPVFTLDTNYLGTRNVLELALAKEATMLQASTSEIYGDPTLHPQTESYWGNVNCFGPRACYDEGKRVAETLMLEYARRFGARIKVVRIFNTYGPRMDPEDGRIVSQFIVQALRGEPITIFGDGSQTRSFCYVDDLIDGLVKMATSEASFTGPVNLGSQDELTVLEVARIIKEMTGSPSPIVFRALPEDDPKKRKPDIALAESRLDWRPVVPFGQGVKLTIEYFRSADLGR
ncbi:MULTISPECIES: UDP-glucuronic acid decarboxylase family protein [unclassified Mycobacterium]|uniref:UDP-glucuronic acid decarboxylase family protein n=1 Tax=unclassified Mycobacterium TaxID=2642494 RepID=UPI000800DE1E|nr:MULTISPECIES: UDP-glucuronic acid decarboxylase family protein [unclassified Mycobacterium]OBG54566.1 NAD-dependent dehydratase [Mycobacterium sp. E188]OBG64073.1 NAD-dependent dehydratase [Mycobacterium sp. E735]OBH17099.1 NAD-dependent dehydratase [Mycobacterium sp. E1715]OBH38972.1 NAD-dependent dehydratase [Mycobacterium sp. E183]